MFSGRPNFRTIFKVEVLQHSFLPEIAVYLLNTIIYEMAKLFMAIKFPFYNN